MSRIALRAIIKHSKVDYGSIASVAGIAPATIVVGMDTQSKPISVVDLLVASHEAGHAVAALDQGCRVMEMVMLDGEPDQPGGFTQFESYAPDRRLGAVRYIAGPVAEVTAAGALGVLKQSALDALSFSLSPAGMGRDDGQRLAECDLDRGEAGRAAAEALELVLARWPIVEALAAALLDEGRLSAERVEEIWLGTPVDLAVWAEMVWREPDLAV